MQLHTYLNYGGNCEAAFRFYEQHFGGTITMLMRHGEQPGGPPVEPEWRRAVLHARWEEAVRNGTPALITQGGSMSRPILERIGFERVGGVHMLMDAFGGGDT